MQVTAAYCNRSVLQPHKITSNGGRMQEKKRKEAKQNYIEKIVAFIWVCFSRINSLEIYCLNFCKLQTIN